MDGSAGNARVFDRVHGSGGNGGGLKGGDSTCIVSTGDQPAPGLGWTQEEPGYHGEASFGKGADTTNGILSGGGAGFYGGGAGWPAAGGGSGYISSKYLINANTVESTHTGNGECKISELN